jgi:peptidoglycan/LPS O-acetylase OafA/YrhL
MLEIHVKYRAEIDGLRALAVIPVILFHAGFDFIKGGYAGVDIFFVISGYLITTILLTEIKANQFSLMNFYERRARRILPVLVFIILFTMPVAWFTLLPDDMVSFSKSIASISGFVSNVFFWSERGYFGTATELKPLVHTWSLAIEEQYYFLFPLLLILLLNKEKWLVPALVLIGVFSFSLCVWVTKIHVDSAFYLLPTRFWELLLGSLAAVFLLQRQSSNFAFKPVFELIGLALILFAFFFYDEKTLFPGYAALAPTLGTALLICCSSNQSLIGRMLSTPALVGLGLMSYSAYLWHQPIFAFTRYLNLAEPEAQIFVGLIVLTFLFSYLSWKYIETPFRNRQIWPRRHILKLSAGSLAFMLLVGLVGVKNEGFVERFGAEDQLLLKNFVGAAEYTSVLFSSLKSADFSADPKMKKVVFIGDSHAQDLLNAFAESGFHQVMQFSTWQINSECGNLFLKYDFSAKIQPNKLPRCQLMGWYNNEKLQERILQADAVFVASAWTDWVIEALPESVKNIEMQFGKPVLVFGAKSFGGISARKLIRLEVDKRKNYTQRAVEKYYLLNLVLNKNLSEQRFVDLFSIFCDKNRECGLFTGDGNLISYDGVHLTKAGAKHLGGKLKENAALNSFINSL